MKKVLIVATVCNFVASFLQNDINLLLDMGYEIHIASNMKQSLKSFNQIDDVNLSRVFHHQIDFDRSPFSASLLKAYGQIKKLINSTHFDIIHCHTPVAAILARLAAKKERKKAVKVVYTAHGFHFFRGAPLANWIIYYPAEWLCSFFTDTLITINTEDFSRAEKRLHAKKTEYIQGIGLNTEKYSSITVDIKEERKSLDIPDDAILLLSVGELNKNKNHQAVMKALAKLSNLNIHYALAGIGPLEQYLKKLSRDLGIEDRVHILGFIPDIAKLYHTADIFCFPSLREGLPVSLMEAMASGLPCVCSKIRGISDLIDDKKGGLLVNKIDDEGFLKAIEELIDNDNNDEMINYNREKIKQFDELVVMEKMRQIYKSLSNLDY